MKPKDLKAPFSWTERRPYLIGKVLFVPHYYEDHAAWMLPEFEDPQIFGKKAPVFIEYCSGNGDWIIEQAKKHPGYHWIAVEKKFDRVRKIWSKMSNIELNNLLIVSGEAWTFSRYYLRDQSIQGCYINFPDPWPKGKHLKHRLFHELFVQELLRISVPSAQATIVTDDPLWAERIFQAMEKNLGWKSLFTDPFYVTELEEYGSSFFDRLWRDQGRMIHYLQFIKSR